MLTAAICVTLNEWFTDIKKFTLQSSTMSLLFKTYSLVEVTYLLIRFNKTKFFPWDRNNTDRNGANKQNITLRMEKRIR